MCGWPNVRVEIARLENLKVELSMSPSTGIGMFSLFVSLPAGTTMSFRDQRIKVESGDIPNPIFTQFGEYYRGIYGPIGQLQGPLNRSFLVEAIEALRPKEIRVTLPEFEINGRTVHPEAVSFTLSQTPAIVGLCQ
jgi:hypothetical protein